MAQHGITYALLGAVSQNAAGVRGFALKRQCDRLLGHFWQLNLGEVYRILDRLASERLIEQVSSPTFSRRKLYRITSGGQQSLDDFIVTPPTDAPRPLRQELAVKLLFARQHQLPHLLDAIQQQRKAYMHQVHLLDKERRKLEHAAVDSFVTNLLIDGAEFMARAELAWLDHVMHRVRERFATPS